MRTLLRVTALLLAAGIACASPVVAEPSGTFTEGDRLAAAGDLVAAQDYYQQQVQADPTSAEALARLAGMQLLNAHYSDAIRNFQASLTIQGDNPKPFIGMGMAYLHIGDYDLARAALIEAKQRHAANAADIDALVAWIDRRVGEDVPKVH